MALVGDTLYVADTDALLAFPYQDGDTEITAPGGKIIDLPGGTINHHWTKNVIASRDGTKALRHDRLQQQCRRKRHGGEEGRADDLGSRSEDGRASRCSRRASATATAWAGRRAPNAVVAVNERDEIGSDLVPDYMTSVKDGAFYGWPYSYYGQHVDMRPQPPRPDLVAKAIAPDYALGSHTASLGLAFSDGADLGASFAHGVFIGQHGSWNRNPRARLSRHLRAVRGRQARRHARSTVLTGFLSAAGEAQGRPVGVAIDKQGALLVADDVGNVVWRVTRADGK